MVKWMLEIVLLRRLIIMSKIIQARQQQNNTEHIAQKIIYVMEEFMVSQANIIYTI